MPETPRAVPAWRRWLVRAGTLLFVVAVPVAIIGTNVRFLFGEQRLYTFAVNRYHVDEVTSIPKPELLRATRELRGYLFGPDRYMHITVTDNQGRTGPLFNPREVLHMADVRRLVQVIFRLQEAALLIAVGYAALRIALEGRDGARAVCSVAWRTALGFNLAGLAFAVTAVLGFDRLFTQFHLLSFSNDFWLLDPTRDRLVQLFPFEFWQLTTAALVLLTLVESSLLAILARVALARLERPAAAHPPDGDTALAPEPASLPAPGSSNSPAG